ncbi:hypothetical protein [Streptacidiphilus sp. EB129]|uniref:hypothetical protein n=1 Tax=Streptacidiphilus sp. EB129 TaxID=3156262 RepID=UPI003511A8BC
MGLVAAVGLLAGLGAGAGTAAAATHAAGAQPRDIGSLYEAINGVPAHVKRGTSITVTMWYMERSPDSIQVLDDGISLSRTGGVRVDWLDPVTNKWEPTSGSWGNGSYYLQIPSKSRLVYRPGFWAHVSVRITFTKSARLGAYYLFPNAPYGYSMLAKSGREDPGAYITQARFSSSSLNLHA